MGLVPADVVDGISWNMLCYERRDALSTSCFRLGWVSVSQDFLQHLVKQGYMSFDLKLFGKGWAMGFLLHLLLLRKYCWIVLGFPLIVIICMMIVTIVILTVTINN